MKSRKSLLEISLRCEATAYLLPLERIRRTTRMILKKLGIQASQLQILFVTDAAIRKINRQFLRHDRSTDVIAFGYLPEGARPQKGVASHLQVLGDIAISLQTTERQAGQYGNSFFYELMFYICHGILHILGWDDNTKSKRDRMLKKQELILKEIGIA